jgi:GDP/UDP-N,N'-diacetylbacillosamine 2-epimerase (hydrolysing)
MKKIAFITSGRSDYALLKPLLDELKNHSEFDIQLIVTGTHLSKMFGKTIQEIKHKVTDRVDILFQSNNSISTANSIGLGIIKFSELFIKRPIDLLFLIGDRFEILAAAIAAYTMKIPIAHYGGGETTQGMLDAGYRNCISAMSKHHFVTHSEYGKNIRNGKVNIVGSLSIDNMKNLLSRDELSIQVRMNLHKYIVITYHPETTKDKLSNITDFYALLSVIDAHPEYEYVFTFANQDSCGMDINRSIVEFVKKHKYTRYMRYAGNEIYLSLLKYADIIVGNSSSGVVEAPYFGTPVINVGDRQKGRVMSNKIMNVKCNKYDIEEAFQKAERYKSDNIFGENAVIKIIEVLKCL